MRQTLATNRREIKVYKGYKRKEPDYLKKEGECPVRWLINKGACFQRDNLSSVLGLRLQERTDS